MSASLYCPSTKDGSEEFQLPVRSAGGGPANTHVTALTKGTFGVDVLTIGTSRPSARFATFVRLADRDERSHGHDEQNCAHIDYDCCFDSRTVNKKSHVTAKNREPATNISFN